MAAIGIAETAYLIRERYASRKPICPIGGGCSQVLESRYNKTLGVYNDLLGLAFYVTMAFLATLLLLEVGASILLNQIAAVSTGIALLMSARFFYLQWRVIHAWCFWCLLSALTITLMSLILLLSGLSLSV